MSLFDRVINKSIVFVYHYFNELNNNFLLVQQKIGQASMNLSFDNQKLTNQYTELLIRFYNKVARKHQRNTFNSSISQVFIEKEQLQQASQFKISKKMSRQTQCSLEQSNQNKGDILNQYEDYNLFFTFNPKTTDNIQRNSQKMKLKYQNQSIYKVLLYFLIFNNQYMQALSQTTTLKISDAYNLNNYNIAQLQSIMISIIGGQGPCILNRRNQNLCNILEFLRNQKKCSQMAYHQGVKSLIDSIDFTIIQQIFARLINSDRLSNLHRSEEMKNPQAKSFEKICKKLGLRVELKTRDQSIRCGSKKSFICIQIKGSQKTGKFSLNEISYYSKQRQQSRIRNNQKQMKIQI